ncbi:glutathione S-transferase C-terminal domain-containing protein homolog isoform X1 [Aedes aegypti]|uniref:Methyltransferase domain-containing protein n=1 Tax=Aedes aegypti TaxID=7159 RepID=A0A6I8TDI9_AEDAE|nr:glutathione S-transferase C-terminal domain-containing protein homolog isoform X1 [Aedes aegypti]XP_021700314.1 glutathione S-transferase C-terminal domain-containing protein homolog isoform X1 [Aedes aegypti]
MIFLYLEYYLKRCDEGTIAVEVPIESYVVLGLSRYLRHPAIGDNLLVSFVQRKTEVEEQCDSVWLDLTGYDVSFFPADRWPKPATFCQLPSLKHNVWIVSGLCGICRHITKYHRSSAPSPKPILGFKGNTLLAPAEVSMWTKFCEVDIVECVREVLRLRNTSTVTLPEDIGKLESHLAQPLKVHNIYKLVNDMQNVKVSSSKEYELSGEAVQFDFHENHKFAEGFTKTLADVMLFICIHLINKRLPIERLQEHLPRITNWYDRVVADDECELMQVCEELILFDQALLKPMEADQLKVDVPTSFSLYKADTKKLNLLGDKVLTTNQPEVLGILEKVKRLELSVESMPNDRDENLFDWDAVPLDAKPEGGKLPTKRIDRKTHQLECLANEVIALAKPGHIIVDFCSGTGHLGILLAFLLPKCTIYLLENKEESQQLAMDRVRRLGLKNVVYFRCNLDYFKAPFDIGVSLHACGVATDIVLEKCFAHRAKFVCCPCCYGKLYEFDRIRYPRSRVFQESELLLKEYLCLAHCADQTHDLDNSRTNVEKSHQGFYCMDIIDKDRLLQAEELGYSVTHKRLKPENCTPKNRLLIGTL